MRRIEFHNREKEIKEIRSILHAEPSLITFVYGPINSGKTTLILPITVRAEPEQTVDTSGSEEKGSSTPGFAAVVAIIGLLVAYLRRKRA
jgi:PGF-CTERM protein